MAETVGINDYYAEVKLFGRWSYDDVEVKDMSLEDYIAVKSKHVTYLPHTAGRYASKRFRKSQVIHLFHILLLLFCLDWIILYFVFFFFFFFLFQ